MSDKDRGVGKILGVIASIIGIIWISIQINEKTNFINSIKIFITNSWVWFIRAKIPLSWIPIGILVYYIGKYLWKDNEVIVKDTRKRENRALMNLLDDGMYRAIIGYCDEPRDADLILKKISRSFRPDYGATWKINVILRNLEERNGLIYLREKNI